MNLRDYQEGVKISGVFSCLSKAEGRAFDKNGYEIKLGDEGNLIYKSGNDQVPMTLENTTEEVWYIERVCKHKKTKVIYDKENRLIGIQCTNCWKINMVVGKWVDWSEGMGQNM